MLEIVNLIAQTTETDGGSAAAGIVGILLVLGLLVFAVVATVIWIGALIKIVQSDESEFVSGSKIIWVLVVLFAGLPGAAIWYFIDYKQRP